MQLNELRDMIDVTNETNLHTKNENIQSDSITKNNNFLSFFIHFLSLILQKYTFDYTSNDIPYELILIRYPLISMNIR